jgi:hypothetical protein
MRSIAADIGRPRPLTNRFANLSNIGWVPSSTALTTAYFCIFDLIELNGDDLRRDPLQVRKATLASILAKASPGMRFKEHIEGDGPRMNPPRDESRQEADDDCPDDTYSALQSLRRWTSCYGLA